MPRWLEFEKLAHKIMSELQPYAEVKHNDHIFDYRTRKKRQIDVSIRWKALDEDYLTIVQAKDYERPANIGVIDAFRSVINNIKATNGILICKSGFTKTARTYAQNVGIALLNLHDAQSANWSLQLTVPIIWLEFTPVVGLEGGVNLEKGDTLPTHDPLGIPMTSDDGTTRIDPMSTFKKYWNGPNANRSVGVRHYVEPDKPLRAIVRDNANVIRFRNVSNFKIYYTVTRNAWLGKFRPDECRGLIDYLDSNAFTLSYLPLSEIPTKRDDQWEEVIDPTKVAGRIRGTVVTTAQTMTVSGLRVESTRFKYFPGMPKVNSKP